MFDTETFVKAGGPLLIFLAVYGQTGLFFCFFLPSGGLLFMAGVLIATDLFDHSLMMVCGLGILASVAGNITGYSIGYKTGTVLYRKVDSRFFKKQYLTAAEKFYRKYGKMALSIGIFLPIIRTFGPIVAGIIRLKFSSFLLYISIGSVAWVVCFTMAGYLIGSMPFLKLYLKYVIAAIILGVTIPIVVRIVKEFKKG